MISKYTGKEYGAFACCEEVEAFTKHHTWLIVCDMTATKEERRKKVKNLWNQLEAMTKTKRSKPDKEVAELREKWMEADFEYTALYDEEY